MIDPDTLFELRSILRTREQLHDLGMQDRALRRALEHGEWVRARRGWFVEAETWRCLPPERRHLARIIAASRSARRDPVFSHASAAILHGLPIYRLGRSAAVHTVVEPRFRSNSSPATIRHVSRCEGSEIVAICGIRCTSIDRTVLDIARSCSMEVSVVCADAALRRALERMAPEVWFENMSQRIEDEPYAAGNLMARRSLSFVDGSAESPLESVSRLYSEQLGLEVETQVAIPSPNHGQYRVDFHFPGLGVFGEVDGKAKYFEARFTSGRTPEQVLLAEKERADWIMGFTGKRVIRWGAEHLDTMWTFATRLRSFGLELPISGRHPYGKQRLFVPSRRRKGAA